jgi:hypothetical protein
MLEPTDGRTTVPADPDAGCVLGWPGLDADAVTQLSAPFQAYPRLLMTVHRAWFEMGVSLVMGGISANQRLLRRLSEQWNLPEPQRAAAMQAAVFDATHEAMTEPVRIVTQFQQRLLGACDELSRGAIEISAASDDAACGAGAGSPNLRRRIRKSAEVQR